MQVTAKTATAKKFSALLAVLVVFTVTPSLSYAETLAEAMEKCRLVSNSLKRLVCYDQLAQRANTLDDSELQEFYAKRPVVSPLPNAGEDRQPVPPPKGQPQNTFGLENQIQRQSNEANSEMAAVVGKVEKGPKGKLIVTLDDGAVWKQTDTGRLTLKSGDSIEISRGMLGAFYLKKAGGKKRIRVKRSS